MRALGFSEEGRQLSQCFTLDVENGHFIKAKAAELLESLGHVLTGQNKRKTIDDSVGLWLTTRKNSGVFFALVSPTYPEYVGYRALDELESIYAGFLRTHDLARLKEESTRLLAKFNRPENFDKLTAAHQNVRNLTKDVQENIDKLVANDENLNELDSKARQMKETANLFNKKADQLKKTLWWRNMRLWIIIIAVVIAIVVLIVLLVVLLKP